MIAVVHAVVREKEKRSSSITVWNVFHVLMIGNVLIKFPPNLSRLSLVYNA